MMNKIKLLIKHNWKSILSGVLIGTSYIPFPPWAIIFAYAPLWIQIVSEPNMSLKQAFARGWWTQFVLTLIGFHWIAFVSHEYGHIPWPVSAVILLLFASAMHLYIPLATLFSHWLRQRLNLHPVSLLFTLALSTSLFEVLWPSLFQWNLGYTLYGFHLPWAQLAEYVGILGLSCAIFLINALVAWCYFSRSKRSFIAVGLTAALILALIPVGLQLETAAQKSNGQFSILLVQPNIGNTEKYYAERGAGYIQYILDKDIEVTDRGLTQNPDVDLVAWAETAFPEFLNTHHYGRRYTTQLVSYIQKTKKNFYIGAYSKDGPGVKKPKDYNATFLLDENAQPLAEPYHKTHLLIFGEYAPFVETFPWIAKINPGGEGFGRGSGPTVFPFKNFWIGNQICYESLDPRFSAKLSLLGANVIFNVTNDSWFNPMQGPYFEARQHRDMTFARAIETRRPVVRITNTGYSSVALADGSILPQGPLFQEWAGRYEVKINTEAPVTFYARYGQWLIFVIICGLILSLWLGSKTDPTEVAPS